MARVAESHITHPLTCRQISTLLNPEDNSWAAACIHAKFEARAGNPARSEVLWWVRWPDASPKGAGDRLLTQCIDWLLPVRTWIWPTAPPEVLVVWTSKGFDAKGASATAASANTNSA